MQNPNDDMRIFSCYQSALEYWRINRVIPVNSISRKNRANVPNKPPSVKQVRSLGLKIPVHVMFRDSNKRWGSQSMVQHIFMEDAPAGSFLNVNDELEVSSPEFCFLQMARQLSLIELIELGYELCGSYSIPNEGDCKVPDRGFHNRKPLTSIKRISELVEQMPGFRGQVKAMRALRYLSDGSASPMETKLTMFLTLPYRLGGFGLPAPKLNARITPSKAARKSSSKAFYICDLFWPEHDLAVEYDSDLFHTGAEHIADDSRKRNALTLMGVTVITVTTKQLYNRKEFDKTVRVIAKCLGKRLVYNPPDFFTANRKLRKELLSFDDLVKDNRIF